MESSTLIIQAIKEAPVHSVLPKSWTYDVRLIRYVWGQGEFERPKLYLDLSSPTEYVSLVFDGVRNLCIPYGELISGISVKVLNVGSVRNDAPGRIRVQHPKGGGLEFWADDVAVIARTPGVERGRECSP